MVYERLCGCVPEMFYARSSQVNVADPDGDCTYA